MNSWIQWPHQYELLCAVVKDKATPGSTIPTKIPAAKVDDAQPLTLPMLAIIERVFKHQYRFMIPECILDSMHKSGGTCHLKVRGLEMRGNEIHVRRLWECPLKL